MEGGEAKRITALAGDVVDGISSTGGFWSWPLPGFRAALADGRIQRTDRAQPLRPPPPARHRPYLTEAARHALVTASEHPLLAWCGEDLPRTVMRALQGLRRDGRVEPPFQLVLCHVARTGAEALGLGPSVAQPARKGGRLSKDAQAARELQALLARFEVWLGGVGDLASTDLWKAEQLALTGLQALTDTDADRPQDAATSARQVQQRLARHRRRHERGAYTLGEAIREVAAQEVLHAKRVAAAWRGRDPDKVFLDRDDDEVLRQAKLRVERAYHRAAPMTAEEQRAHRSLAALALKARRRT